MDTGDMRLAWSLGLACMELRLELGWSRIADSWAIVLHIIRDTPHNEGYYTEFCYSAVCFYSVFF